MTANQVKENKNRVGDQKKRPHSHNRRKKCAHVHSMKGKPAWGGKRQGTNEAGSKS